MGDDTPLHLATAHGHRDIVNLVFTDYSFGVAEIFTLVIWLQLLKNKADINFVNEHGNTPLHYACFWGFSQVAEDLVNYGAYVSVANKYGEIPLDKCSGAVAKRLHGK